MTSTINQSMTSRQMRGCLEEIRRAGRSEKSARIFLNEICPALSIEHEDLKSHCLAVAELMSRLAPKGQSDLWYAVGLTHRLPDLWDIGYEEKDKIVFSSLMRKAGYNNDAIYCIEKFGQRLDPETWTQMMTALVYASTHTTEAGEVLTTPLCCKRNEDKDRAGMISCVSCMYVWYRLSGNGEFDRYEEIASGLRDEMLRREHPAGKESGS